MELDQARYFIATAEHLNFTRAAEACNISQPSLTVAIKKLEDEFGGALFHREGKRILMTELGQRLLPFITQMAEQAESVRQAAKDFRLLRQVPLKIGIMNTIGPMRLSALLAGFKEQHPGIELGVHEGSLDELQAKLDIGEIDMAVLHAPRGYPPSARAMPLYRERYVVIVPPGHPFERQDTVRLGDTRQKAYVDRLACEMRETVMHVCGQNNIELYASFRSEREDWIQGMVMAGLGFAFMPEYSVTHTGILRRPLVEPSVEREVCLVNMAGRQLSPAGQAFARATQAHRWG
ncbi:LysR family transcriptional regulator [Bosea sp. (in: a-proteobacteria)]|jgi:DNA-binding transcriptional LysR family regulator|uniref:LysR family transcriptional regulator n=1 Tax=Bosea sp. (in: a-proteobacteria) TaxID=1871050 RepID=UPI002DDC9F6D|nr:LysR family transcriptional regulator [Bosea sp. (in: a-proteobacteria)]HEV2512983.1 LysR family transcriptional regulator [Bosea sp. (in: a-proteobacteria)]